LFFLGFFVTFIDFFNYNIKLTKIIKPIQISMICVSNFCYFFLKIISSSEILYLFYFRKNLICPTYRLVSTINIWLEELLLWCNPTPVWSSRGGKQNIRSKHYITLKLQMPVSGVSPLTRRTWLEMEYEL
jgi:hypothetical protein